MVLKVPLYYPVSFCVCFTISIMKYKKEKGRKRKEEMQGENRKRWKKEKWS